MVSIVSELGMAHMAHRARCIKAQRCVPVEMEGEAHMCGMQNEPLRTNRMPSEHKYMGV